MGGGGEGVGGQLSQWLEKKIANTFFKIFILPFFINDLF